MVKQFWSGTLAGCCVAKTRRASSMSKCLLKGEWTRERIRAMAEHADYAPVAERAAKAVLRRLANSGAA
jgi:hypothetical protein